MRRRSTSRALATLAALALAAGCTDDIPTLSEAGELAPGTLPTTIEHLFTTDEVVLASFGVRGGTDIGDAAYLLVANRFGGALDAHLLAQFAAFPDTVELAAGTDTVAQYLDSEVFAIVADTIRVSDTIIGYQLWTVTQDWNATATWEHAVFEEDEQVLWVTPGGARGQLLGTVRWDQAATTAGADSLVWPIPPDVVQGLASGEIPGLMVTLEDGGTRAHISRLAVRANIQPKVDNDTTVTRIVGPARQHFVFQPEPPQSGDALSVGGVTSDRSYFWLDLEKLLPICVPATPACTNRVPVREVSLNRVELVLEPLPVPSGYRPVAPYQFFIRQVLEPELGARAPLGPIIAVDTVTVAQGAGVSPEPVRINLTTAVQSVIGADTADAPDTSLAVALLVDPEGSRFSYAWFAPNARLRFIYTLPQQPQLP